MSINYLDVLCLAYQGPYTSGTLLQVLDVESVTFPTAQTDGLGAASYTIRAPYESAQANQLLAANRVDLWIRQDILTQASNAVQTVFNVQDGTRFKVGDAVAFYNGTNYDVGTAVAPIFVTATSATTITLNQHLTRAYGLYTSVMVGRHRGTVSFRDRDAAPGSSLSFKTFGYVQDLANRIFTGNVGQGNNKECGYVMYQVLNSFAGAVNVTFNAANFVMSSDGTLGSGTGVPFTGSSQGVSVQRICDDITTVANSNAAGTKYTWYVDFNNAFHFQALPTTPSVTLNINGKPTAGNTGTNVTMPADGMADVISKYVSHDQDISGVLNAYFLTGATDPTTNQPVSTIVADSTSISQYTQKDAVASNQYITDATTLANWGKGILKQTAFPNQFYDLELSATRSFIDAQTCIKVVGFTDGHTETYNPVSTETSWNSRKPGVFTQRIKGANPNPDADRELKLYAAERYIANSFAQGNSFMGDRFVQSYLQCLGSFSGATFNMTAGTFVALLAPTANAVPSVETQFTIAAQSITPSADGTYTVAYLYRNLDGTRYSSPSIIVYPGTTASNYTGTGAPITDYMVAPFWEYSRYTDQLGISRITGIFERRNVVGVGTNHFQQNPNNNAVPSLAATLGALTYANVQSTAYEAKIASVSLSVGAPPWLQGTNWYAVFHGDPAPTSLTSPYFTLTSAPSNGVWGVTEPLRFQGLTAGQSYDLYVSYLDNAGRVSAPLFLTTTAANPTATMPGAVTITATANGSISYANAGGTEVQATVPFNLTITDSTGNQTKWLNGINVLGKQVAAGSSVDSDTNYNNYFVLTTLPANRWSTNPTAISAIVPLPATATAYELAIQIVDVQGNVSLAAPFVVTTPQNISAAIIPSLSKTNFVADSGFAHGLTYWKQVGTPTLIIYPGAGTVGQPGAQIQTPGANTNTTGALYNQPFTPIPGQQYALSVAVGWTDVGGGGTMFVGMCDVADYNAGNVTPSHVLGTAKAVPVSAGTYIGQQGVAPYTWTCPSSGGPTQVCFVWYWANANYGFSMWNAQIEPGAVYTGYVAGETTTDTGAGGTLAHGSNSSTVKGVISSTGAVNVSPAAGTTGTLPYTNTATAITGAIDSSSNIKTTEFPGQLLKLNSGTYAGYSQVLASSLIETQSQNIVTNADKILWQQWTFLNSNGTTFAGNSRGPCFIDSTNGTTGDVYYLQMGNGTTVYLLRRAAGTVTTAATYTAPATTGTTALQTAKLGVRYNSSNASMDVITYVNGVRLGLFHDASGALTANVYCGFNSDTANNNYIRSFDFWFDSQNLDDIGDGASMVSLPAGNVSGTGSSKRALIDHSQAHLNKNIDYFIEGTTNKYFNGKTVDNLPDGSTYGSLPLVNVSGTGTGKRALIDYANTNNVNVLPLAKHDQVIQNRVAIHGGSIGAVPYINGYTLTFPSDFNIFRPDGSYSYIAGGSTVTCSGNSGYGFVFIQWVASGAGTLVYVPRPSLSSTYTGSTAYELIGQTTGSGVFNSPYAANANAVNAAQSAITQTGSGSGILNIDTNAGTRILQRGNHHPDFTSTIDSGGGLTNSAQISKYIYNSVAYETDAQIVSSTGSSPYPLQFYIGGAGVSGQAPNIWLPSASSSPVSIASYGTSGSKIAAPSPLTSTTASDTIYISATYKPGSTAGVMNTYAANVLQTSTATGNGWTLYFQKNANFSLALSAALFADGYAVITSALGGGSGTAVPGGSGGGGNSRSNYK